MCYLKSSLVDSVAAVSDLSWVWVDEIFLTFFFCYDISVPIGEFPRILGIRHLP